jgi:uncharacterized protein (DUF2141 family)
MKVFIAIFAFLVVYQASMQTPKTESATKQTITVTVPNVTSDKGTVNYALFTKEGFMVKPVQTQLSTVKGKKSTVIFTDVASGEYAITCFHDANSNKKMDFEANGMPLEDYGISNNPISYGPPEYDTAKFVVADKNVTLEIRF